jgi:hypothetical protein
MNRRSISPFLVGLVLLFTVPAGAQDRQPDELTRQLFEQYLRGGKIDTASVMAATQLVAERGRENGFWKDILAELKRNNQNSEIECVRVLGKMLATDAVARDAIRRSNKPGEPSQQGIPRVCLEPEVVTVLLERGGKADRFQIDHYAIALARARVPDAHDFFKSILRATTPGDPFGPAPSTTSRRDTTTTPVTKPDGSKVTNFAPTNPYHLESTRFHAAVGLAQLGDSEGIDWLIANCGYSEGTVLSGRPQGAPPGGGLSACCVKALRQLSGERTQTSKTEWAAWWKSADKKRLLDHAVVFGDP